MKKILLFLTSLFVGLFIFVLVVGKIGLRNVIQSLSLFKGLGGVAIFIITCLIVLLSIWKWKFIFKTQGYNLSIFTLGKIWTAGFTIRYLTPLALLGGEAFRMYSVKKIFSLPWEKSIAATLIDKLLSLSIFLLFLIFGIFSFFLLAGFPHGNIGIIIGGTIFVLTIILCLLYFKIFKKESILKWFLNLLGIKNNKNSEILLNTEKEIFSFFRPKKRWMWQGLGIALLNYFLILIRCFLIIFFLRGGTNILISFAVYASANLAYFFPVPATLGVLEASQAFTFGFLGLGSDMGTAFSFILRGSELLICLVGIIFLIKFGMKFFETKVANKITSVLKPK